MKVFISKYKKSIVSFSLGVILVSSCGKKEIVNTNVSYPDQTVYLAQASVATLGPSGNGVYSITPAIYNQAQRFSIDKAGKVNIPLGVIRSGVYLNGTIPVAISANADTIGKLITAGKFAVADPTITTEVLPTSAFTVPPTTTIEDGSTGSTFIMGLDLNFLINSFANTPKKRYAIAVSIVSTTGKSVKTSLSTVVILIDPSAIIAPVANFTNYNYNDTKTANFINLSANGVSYSWNYGDGTPAETTVSPSHVFSASGTYMVTLTTTGIAGSGVAAVKTNNVVIK